MLQGEDPDPIKLLLQFNFANAPDTPFLAFAKRILSISANSASCERLFSLFGNILTKLRNRLNTHHVADIAEICMHIRDEHLENKSTIQERIKKIFEGPPGQSGNTGASLISTEIQNFSIMFQMNQIRAFKTIPLHWSQITK